MFVVVFGNPFDGMSVHGPFQDSEDANRYAEDADCDWWLMDLTQPEQGSEGCVHMLLKQCSEIMDAAANFLTDEQILPSSTGDDLAEALTEVAMHCRDCGYQEPDGTEDGA